MYMDTEKFLIQLLEFQCAYVMAFTQVALVCVHQSFEQIFSLIIPQPDKV